MRKLLILLLVLGALAIGADSALKRVAEGGVATEMASALELPEAPDVTIEAFPFTPRFLSGELPAVEVRAERAEAGELTLRDIELRLRDLRFDTADVVRGRVEQVRTGGGSGTATVTESSLAAALQGVAGGVELSFADGEVTARTGAGEVTGDVAVEGNRLVVSAGDALSAGLDLPSLGGRVRYDSLEITGGEIVVEFTLEAGRLNRG